MSTLTLKITADDAGLIEIKKATAELKQLLRTSKVPSVEAVNKLTVAMKGLETMTSKATKTTGGSTVALDSLAKAELKATATTRGLAGALDSKLDPALKKTAVSSTALRDATRGAAAAGGSLWMAYGQILPMMAAFLTTATAIKGVSIAAEFEAQTVYMVALAEATGDYSMSLEDVQGKILGLKGLTTGPSDIANAAKELVKAGFTTKQALSEIEALSKTSFVAQEKLEIVTRGVAAQYRAWGQSAVGAERGVSSLKQTANIMGFVALKTALDFGELNDMMAHTTELAPLSGASFEELTAMLGFMSNMGITGTKAATSLRTGILRLQDPTNQARVAMAGLSVQFSHMDEKGELKNLTDLFEDLGKSMEPLTSESRMRLMNKIFSLRSLKGGTAALKALSKSVDDGSFSFRELVTAAKEAGASMTFIDGLATEMATTSSAQWEILKASFSNEMAKAFDDTNGALTGLLTTLNRLVDDGAFRKLLDDLAHLTSGFILVVEKLAEVNAALDFLPKYGIGPAIISHMIDLESTGIKTSVKKSGEELAATFSKGFNNALDLEIAPAPLGVSTKVKETPEYKGRTSPLMSAHGNQPRLASAKHAPLGTTGGSEVLVSPEHQKLEAWQKQNELRVERDKIKSFTKTRVSQNAIDLSFHQAQLRARQISEEQFLRVSQSLRAEDLSLKLSEAKTILALDQARAKVARDYAATQGASKDAGLGAETAAATATAKVIAQMQVVVDLKAKSKAQGSIFDLEDLARVKEIDRSLYGLTDSLRDLVEETQNIYDYVGLDEGAVRQAEIEKDLNREKLNSLRALKDARVSESSEEFLRTQQLYADKLTVLREYYAKEQQLRSDGAAGATQALADYAYEAKDTYGQINEVTARSLQGMEDALVKFVETGKLSFKDLANSILKDLTRILVKKALAGLVETAIGSFSGTGTSSIDGSAMPAVPVSHAGGIVGASTGRRNVSPSVFNGAPKLHNGLRHDEFPTILQRGEEVTSVSDVKRNKEMSSAPTNVQVNITNEGGEEKQGSATSRYDEMRGLIIDVVLTDINSGGPLRTATSGTGV